MQETQPPARVTAHGLSTFLGARTDETIARVFAGEQRFAAPSQAFPLPFEAVVGEMADPPALTGPLARWDTRLTRMLLAAGGQIEGAVRAAAGRYGPRRVALVHGTSTGGIDATERAYAALRAGRAPGSPFRYADHHPLDRGAEALAQLLGLEGPRLTVSTACSSSGKALGSALRLLASGVADAVVVAGADTLCRTTLHGFGALGALSPRGTRPFARDPDGITLSEGAGCVLLERDGPGLAGIAAVGESSDAYHGSAPEPEGQWAMAAMADALERAGLGPADVDAVSAHGTGTPHNDRSEARAIARLFGDRVPVCATKSVTGHLLGASAVTAVVLAVESIRRGLLPPTAGADETDPALGVRVVRRPEAAALRRVLVNSFAFGGHNASVLVVA